MDGVAYEIFKNLTHDLYLHFLPSVRLASFSIKITLHIYTNIFKNKYIYIIGVSRSKLKFHNKKKREDKFTKTCKHPPFFRQHHTTIKLNNPYIANSLNTTLKANYKILLFCIVLMMLLLRFIVHLIN